MRALKQLRSFCIVAALVAALPAGASVLPVMSGLNNPRGIAIGPNGAVYVAEAGLGGNLAILPSEEGPQGVGFSGSITRLLNGHQDRIVTGLPSAANPDGSFASGPVDVSVAPDGSLRFIIGGPGDPLIRNTDPALAHFGFLGMFRKGRAVYLNDVASFELTDPAGDGIDSDPYSLLADGETTVVADAAGNTLLRVGPGKQIQTLAVFPARLANLPFPPFVPVPMQSVPTSVVKGPDGAYYVGELTGFPFPVGAARVYRVVPGQAPTIYADGFTNIIDIAFGPDGSLYVLEITANGMLSGDPTGALIKVAPNGDRTTIMSSGLVFPGGLAVAADGTIYVSNFSVFAGAGQVLKINP